MDLCLQHLAHVDLAGLNAFMVDQQANYGNILYFYTPGDIDGSTGAYAGAGYLFTTLNNSWQVSGYARWLDLDQAIARTTWTQGDIELNRLVLYPLFYKSLTDLGSLPPSE